MNNDIFNRKQNDDFNVSEIETGEYHDNVSARHSINQLFEANKTRVIIGIILICLIVGIIIASVLHFIPEKITSYEMNPSKTNLLYIDSSLEVSNNLNDINKNSEYLEKAITTFVTENEYVIDIETEKSNGEYPKTLVIPLQEGVANVNIDTSVNKKIIKSDKQSIIVCPSFDKSLLFSNRIAITQGSKYSLNLDFGEGICSSDIVYSSSNNNIFNVTNDGVITGVGIGSANLLITKGQNIINVPVDIVRKKVSVSNINSNVDKVSLVSGENVRLNTNYEPYNATDVNLSFTSSNEDIVSVNNRGLIKANNPGVAKIIISSGDVKKEIEVFVENMYSSNLDVTDIALETNDLTLKKGKTKRINYYTLPDGSYASRTGWISSNEKAVIVMKGGVVHAKEVGTATITAINNDVEKSIRVNVTE